MVEKNINHEIKIIRIAYCIIATMVVVVGFGFSYLIADLEDAPGIVIIGATITIVCKLIVYGICQTVIALKRNNAILSDIYKELANKNK